MRRRRRTSGRIASETPARMRSSAFRHGPARADVTACHQQIMATAPHGDDDIIDVHEHRQMLVCMAQKGYAFQSSDTECVTRMTKADDAVCYTRD